MPDFLNKRERSALMSRIRGKNTEIERTVFGLLRRCAIPFSRHDRKLPGCPDVVIRKAKVAVFVDGDFWHGRGFKRWRHTLAPFWATKIEVNIRRDRATRKRLQALGWKVLRIWGKDIKRKPDCCLNQILKAAGMKPGA